MSSVAKKTRESILKEQFNKTLYSNKLEKVLNQYSDYISTFN
jgi:hypothetical protein